MNFSKLTRDEFRKAYYLNPNSAAYQESMQRHPDLRLISCPWELLTDDDLVVERQGSGFVIGDGSYYDPCMDKFLEILTV